MVAVPILVLHESVHTPSLLPQPSEVQAYSDFASVLCAALNERGVVVFELGDDRFSPFRVALEANVSFFESGDLLKMDAKSMIPGEGYVQISGKELLGMRLGSNGWGSGRLRKHYQTLATASAELDRLGRTILSAVCRSPELDVHPGGLLGLLDDAPLLRGRASASVLRCSQYPAGASADALAFSPHHDRGVVTLVTSLQAEGLQVQLPAAAGGQWVDVPLGPGRVAVLAGYSLSYALGGLLQPVLHRVRPCGGPVGRTSLAYELCFESTAQVDPAAITRRAATQPGPAGRTSRPLHVSELMQLFDVTHPQSINGVGGVAPVAANGAAAAPELCTGGAAAQTLDPRNVRPRAPAEREEDEDGDWQQAQARESKAPRLEGPCVSGGRAASAEAVLNIAIGDHTGEVHFKVASTCRFAKVFRAFGDKRGVNVGGIRFAFDGGAIRKDDTPQGLGMEDGDFVNAFTEQLGN